MIKEITKNVFVSVTSILIIQGINVVAKKITEQNTPEKLFNRYLKSRLK